MAPARKAANRSRWKASLVSAFALVTWVGDLPAPEPNILDRSICTEVALQDSKLTVHARRMLADDNLLGPLNVGVIVRNRSATVWGSAPSVEAADRAVKLVRQVPGIAQVTNELVVEKPGDPLFDFLRNTPTPLPGQEPSAQPRRTAHDSAPAQAEHAGARRSVSPTSQSRPSAAPETNIVLMPAIPLPMRPHASSVTSDELNRQIERLCRSSHRYRNVQFTCTQGVVHLHGTVERSEDLIELARAISHIAGVERVVMASPAEAKKR